ncbi:LADA_0C11364g1_1 [Lachancea dasiensis]|uniref:alanine--glyoxylate transaminase n=1 Tax=Lachancea dasiensis TaxID=1072105 RepID=A0A1G4J1Y7_9SACH|nr:LADA_0C11364g1_1 [Lachancea dasiensis]
MASGILLIPGPIVISENVQKALGTPSVSHTSPEFVDLFASTLQKTRQLFQAGESAQPLIVAGSGTLGWDMAASNLIEPGAKVLVLSTGFFSDSFAECLQTYGAHVDKLTAPLGGVVPLSDIRKTLGGQKYEMIVITHVDTSTAVLSDVKSISEVVKNVSPDTLITVDGVCSIGCEEFAFDAWGIDYALSASQKAIGCPPGLSISVLSSRAIEVALNRKSQSSFFASFKKWIPIMQNYEQSKAAYFATPAVQLVNALNVSIGEILEQGLEARIAKHHATSDWFKNKLRTEKGLKLVSSNQRVSAHGLTAVYVKKPAEAISALKKKGIIIAGGIHKDIKGEYIRVGHMGESACNDSLCHIQLCYEALSELEL